jgi:hypothetical protein
VKRLTGGERGDNKWWVSPELIQQLDDLSRRKVPTLIAYGADDPLLREFDRAAEGRLGAILERPNTTIEIERSLPGQIHGFPAIPGQDAFLVAGVAFITRVTG